MKVLLISANRTEINMRTMPLGLAFVAQALTDRHHSVKMIDCVGIDNIGSYIQGAIENFRPDIIGISLRNIDDQALLNTRFLYQDDREIIARARKLSDKPIILGGAGYSMFPEAILADSDADMGIEGEGEAALSMVLEKLEKGESPEGVPGLHIKGGAPAQPRRFIKDTGSFPLPDPHYVMGQPVTADTWVPVQTRRGCAMDCSYCSTASIEGRTLRKRPVASVIEWIGKLVKVGAHQLYFVDNTFNLPRPYALSLCRAITDGGLNIKWRCIIYPWRIDEELVAAMAGAGCFEISLGSESADEEILRRMHKRFGRDDIAHASRLFKKYNIKQMGFFMLGAPGETQQSVLDTLAFAASLELDALKVTVGIRIYPHTALADEARKEGIIEPDDPLLQPRFYITPGLDEKWVRDTVAQWAAKQPNWIQG
ncbi:MAG: Radical domain protein [Deltaproteobacteria bacterium]|nr:Radical domain protein [Deltaproteobacteria bacterium]